MKNDPENCDNHMVTGLIELEEERTVSCDEIRASWIRGESDLALDDHSLTERQKDYLKTLGINVSWYQSGGDATKAIYSKNIANVAIDFIASFDEEISEHILENGRDLELSDG